MRLALVHGHHVLSYLATVGYDVPFFRLRILSKNSEEVLDGKDNISSSDGQGGSIRHSEQIDVAVERSS